MNSGAWSALGTWIAALVAVAAAMLAFVQVHEAKDQQRAANTLAELQREVAVRASLTNLVQELTRETRALVTATGEARLALGHARLADAEEAYGLVGELRRPAPAIDNFEIGDAFAEREEDAKAMVSFSRAGSTRASPVFRAQALLHEAALFAGLGMRRRAASNIEEAANAYDNERNETPRAADLNRTGALLFGINDGMLSCRPSLSHVQALVRKDPAVLTEDVVSALRRATSRCD